MTFQEPSLLYALPAALLPVIIHLLNRLRFRTVRWAATMFLAAAARSSLRRSRLRHYLVLLCRALAIAFLVLALGRPLTGGWMGGLFRGAPDTVLMLLDRSASMETKDPVRQVTRRAYALERFARAARSAGPDTRLVFLESVRRAPQELAGPAALHTLAVAGPTDTAADLPALFRAALDTLTRARAGRPEIWVASDLQRSNWRPDAGEWRDLAARLGALPGRPRVRVLALGGEGGRNAAVAVRGVARTLSRERPAVAVNVRILQGAGRSEPVPLVFTLDGARTQDELTPPSADFRFVRRFDLPAGRTGGGWGRIDLPADANARDNSAWFVYPAETPLRAAAVAEPGEAARRLARAVAPDPARLGVACDAVAPERAHATDWRTLALMVWQAPAPPADVGDALRAFVESGGVVACFPPGRAGVNGPFGLQWKEVESAPVGGAFRAGVWEEEDGPLARAGNGQSLAVGRLAFLRRQGIAFGEGAGETFFSLADFADGRPLLLRRRLGRGCVYACASLPQADWSNLDEGLVLVPMLQRMLQEGAARLTQAENAACGEWQPDDDPSAWTAVDPGGPRDPRWEAGVYARGARRVALNRPAAEDVAEAIEPARIRELFGDVPVEIESELGGRPAAAAEKDVWPLFLALALLALIGESLLVLGYGAARPSASATEGRPA